MSVKSQKLLKSGAPLPGMGNVGSSLGGSDAAARNQREEIEKLQQDIFMLSQRISEAKGEPAPVRDNLLGSSVDAASPFVSSLRALADADRRARDMKEQKVHLLESLLEKVSEYNRLVLAKTAPPETQIGDNGNSVPVRRKSIGSDLATLPSHLRMIDRLFDLHTQAKRITVIRTSDSAPTSARGVSTSTNPNSTNQQQQQVQQLQQQLQQQNATHEAEKIQLKQQIQQLQTTLKNQENQQTQTSSAKNTLQTQLTQLQTQHTTLQASHNTLQNEQKTLRAQYNSLQSEHKNLQNQLSEKSQTEAELAQLQKTLETRLQQTLQQSLQQTQAQQQSLNQQSDLLREEVRMLQSQLSQSQLSKEQTDTQQLALLRAIQRQTLLLGQEETPLSALALQPSEQNRLTVDQQQAIQQLISALHGRLQSLQREVALLLALKEGLEGDLASANLQRDMLQQDLRSVQDEHEALKAAYHSQSYELATRNGTNTNSNAGVIDTRTQEELKQMKAEVETQKDTIRTLENTLQLQRLQLRTLEQWPALVQDLETKVDTAARDKLRLETLLRGTESELQETQKLVQSLRDKVRDLVNSSKSKQQQNTDSNWSDSYEEVMQEELHAMKLAFEAKLKASREEADALSRRHAQEIQRMQQQHSHSTLPNLPTNLSSGLR